MGKEEQNICVIFLYIYKYCCCCSRLLSHVCLFAATWTAACQDPLSMGFFRQEYQSGLPCPPPGDLSDPGSNLGLLHRRQIVYHVSYQGSPYRYYSSIKENENLSFPTTWVDLKGIKLGEINQIQILYASLVAQLVKNTPAMQETLV